MGVMGMGAGYCRWLFLLLSNKPAGGGGVERERAAIVGGLHIGDRTHSHTYAVSLLLSDRRTNSCTRYSPTPVN